MLYVVRGLYRLAQRYKGRERSRQRTEVRPESLFGSVRSTVRLFVFTQFCSSKQMFILVRRQ